MTWIETLKGLPETVALVVVFGAMMCLLFRTVSRQIVQPFQKLVTNHLEHDAVERAQLRKAIDKQGESFERLADALERRLDE